MTGGERAEAAARGARRDAAVRAAERVTRELVSRGASAADGYESAIGLVVSVAALVAAPRRGLLDVAPLEPKDLRRALRDANGVTGARLFGARWADASSHLGSETAEVVVAAVAESGGAPIEYEALPEEEIGWLYEHLLGHEPASTNGATLEVVRARGRKKTGSFYTPPELTRAVVAAVLERHEGGKGLPRICDPALGAGAFLVEAARRVADVRSCSRVEAVLGCVHGADRSPLAVAVAEASLWLLAAEAGVRPDALASRLVVGESLLDLDWRKAFSEAFADGGFDAVVGNPPWIAYMGRAAQPLDESVRALYRAEYSVFRGYPTLHGLFVELATRLAPRGTVGLLLPSPVADLDGYRPVRTALTRTHVPREPLLELGQDAFDGVLQPSFALVADPSVDARPSEAPWVLTERQRSKARAHDLEVPEVLRRLARAEPFPSTLFGERGFQSAGDVSRTLFRRGDGPAREGELPLLEGRDVREFAERPPRLFLRLDRRALAAAGCRVRDPAEYRAIDFVVRQTASYPIAALHTTGLPFRNSLLAGYAALDLPAELVVAVLNSSLHRALHLSTTRDARQAVFPQVKLKHLRALPRPPRDPTGVARVLDVSRRITGASGLTPELRADLDAAVFDLFDLAGPDRAAVLAFLTEAAPRLGRSEATTLPG